MLIPKLAIKKLRGRKVLINFPIIEQPTSVIELSPETQAEVDKELMKKWTHLEVYAVGNLVEDVEVGDVVYLSAQALETADRIEVDGNSKFLVDDYHLNIIW